MAISDFTEFYTIVTTASPHLKNAGVMTLKCKDNCEEIKTKLETKFSLQVDIVGNDTLEFGTDPLPFKIFLDSDDFRKRTAFAAPSYFDKDLAILKYGDLPTFFEIGQGKSYINFESKSDFFLFTNCRSYINFLDFLKGKEHKEDYKFHFVDHYDSVNNLFIFTTAKQAGKLIISIPDLLPDFDVSRDFTKSINEFTSCFDERDHIQLLPKFIKAQLFVVLVNEESNKRMKAWIEKLPVILEVADQNHEIYLSDLSLESFRQDYIEQKDKYLSQLRDIIGKIATQIIGLPIAVTATAAATYTFPANPDARYFVIIVFVCYSALAVALLKLQKDDVSSLKSRVETEFDKWGNNSFFQRYPNELDDFNVAKNELLQKSGTLSLAIWCYALILILTNTWLFNLLMGSVYSPDARFYSLFLALFLFALFLLPYSYFSTRVNDE